MNMVERVARAVYHKRNGAGCKPWAMQAAAHKRPYLDDARAAIEAMRELSEAMEDAGNVPTYQWVDQTAAGVWARMIDAALTETE